MSRHSMNIEAGELAAMIGSRLCHDLVSPLGAIGNGIELLEMSDEFSGLADSAEMRLIAESLAAANNRIAAYRFAFGHTGGTQRFLERDLSKLLMGIIGRGRVKIEILADGDFSRGEMRLVILAAMCIEMAIPWGGKLTVQRTGTTWRTSATAERIRHDPDLWVWLNPETSPERKLAPAEVQFALLVLATAEDDRELTHSISETGVEIAF